MVSPTTNYPRVFKVLGKLAFMFDNASAATVEENFVLATTADQIATGLTIDNPAVLMFAQYSNSLQGAINAGPAAIQTMAKTIAGQYFQLPMFTSLLTNTPASSSVADIIAALALDMASGTDNKTLTTKSGTGLINFFDTVAGTTGTWNHTTDGSADYKDSVYCVDTIV